MDSKILYEKDGMIFTKLDDKKYNLAFSMENKNNFIANIIDFSLFKLIYDLLVSLEFLLNSASSFSS